MLNSYSDGLLEFIDKSPSPFHVVRSIETILINGGFCELSEKEEWKLEKEGRYFVKRNDGAIIAFQLPVDFSYDSFEGFRICAAHSDSPSFMVKNNPEIVESDTYVRLDVEKYGGMILYSWLDRPLSIAGRAFVRENGELVAKRVNIDEDLLVIPSLAIHMDSSLNNGYKFRVSKDMYPLFCQKDEKDGDVDIRDLIAKELDVSMEDIVSEELYLYSRQKAKKIGLNKEFIMAPRLDDQALCYGAAEAFVHGRPSKYITVLAIFNNEEVGSSTMQGADSTFLEDVLLWISEYFGGSFGQYRKKLASSFFVSADNAHGLHPAHPDKADENNRPILNKGVVLKFHGNQKYLTDAYGAAFMRNLAKEAGVLLQDYHNNSDVLGGSTLGNISSSHLSIPGADIGLAQLAMHSAVETCGSRDIEDFINLLKLYFRA